RAEPRGPAPEVLDPPDRAGAAYARLHLVIDVEGPVLAAELEEARGELVGERDEAALDRELVARPRPRQSASAPRGTSSGSGMNPPSPCTGPTTTHEMSCSASSDETSSSASSE